MQETRLSRGAGVVDESRLIADSLLGLGASVARIRYSGRNRTFCASVCSLALRAVQPYVPSARERAAYRDAIMDLLERRNAMIVAHYYVGGCGQRRDVQELAEETGGFVGDSLEMARFGRDCDADVLVVAGVRFMGETERKLVFLARKPADCRQLAGKTASRPGCAARCAECARARCIPDKTCLSAGTP